MLLHALSDCCVVPRLLSTPEDSSHGYSRYAIIAIDSPASLTSSGTLCATVADVQNLHILAIISGYPSTLSRRTTGVPSRARRDCLQLCVYCDHARDQHPLLPMHTTPNCRRRSCCSNRYSVSGVAKPSPCEPIHLGPGSLCHSSYKRVKFQSECNASLVATIHTSSLTHECQLWS